MFITTLIGMAKLLANYFLGIDYLSIPRYTGILYSRLAQCL